MVDVFHANPSLIVKDDPPEALPSPDPTLSGMELWNSMGRLTLGRSNRMGGSWPESASLIDMYREAKIFAGNVIAADCVPHMVVNPQGVTITGTRFSDVFNPVLGSAIRTVVFISTFPKLGEIWISIGQSLECQV